MEIYARSYHKYPTPKNSTKIILESEFMSLRFMDNLNYKHNGQVIVLKNWQETDYKYPLYYKIEFEYKGVEIMEYFFKKNNVGDPNSIARLYCNCIDKHGIEAGKDLMRIRKKLSDIEDDFDNVILGDKVYKPKKDYWKEFNKIDVILPLDNGKYLSDSTSKHVKGSNENEWDVYPNMMECMTNKAIEYSKQGIYPKNEFYHEKISLDLIALREQLDKYIE